MAKSTCCGRVFPAEPELWQQQRNPIALFALHHRDDLARLLRT
ncbi:hypothetical protein [Cyanobium sp. Maggiore-St4-Cus]|nr:hypothetical protein [Cyanobium sp. Maggiore-St4-Cus]